MSKNIFSDIKLKRKETFNINYDSVSFNSGGSELKSRMHSTPGVRSGQPSVRKSILIFFVLSLLIGGGYYASNIFFKADVVITEKHQTFNLLDKQFNLSKKPNEIINFGVMIIPDKKEKEVVFTESQNISQKAKGEIALYNEFSTKPQTLTAGTFIADNTGKAYKTDKTISIPGFTSNKSKVVPGLVVTSITAFLPGSSYNGAPTDFFITSFKNNTKYKKIYGKAHTEFTGGAEGQVFKIDKAQKDAIDVEIASSSLKDSMLKKIEVPPGFILYPDATTFLAVADYGVLSSTPNTKVVINSTLSAFLIKEDDLSNALIKEFIPNVSPARNASAGGDKELNEIKIQNIDKLKFSFTNKNQTISKDMESISFSLNGSLEAIWHPNLNSLKSSLSGVSKNTTQAIFSQDVGIERATVKIFPPWAPYLPSDISKIHINIAI